MIFSKHLLAAAAILGASSVFAQEPDYLEFDPPGIDITDLKAFSDFQVRLKAPPNGTAVVYWETPGLKSTQCTTTWTTEDWNIFKPVRVQPLKQYSKVGEETYKITAQCDAPTEPYHTGRQFYPVKRTYVPAVDCTILDDPHFKTFGGTRFDYQTTSTFYAIKSDMLTVEMSQFICVANPADPAASGSCTNGVAIRYGQAIVIVNVNEANQLTINQVSDTVEGLEITQGADSVTAVIKIPADETEITMTGLGWLANMDWINTVIRIGGTYLNQVGGLCNVYTGKPDDGLECSNGVKTTSPKIFGDSWIVPENDDIFKCGAKCVGGKGGNTNTGDGKICKIPLPFPPPAPEQPAPPKETHPPVTTEIIIPTTIVSVITETYEVPATKEASTDNNTQPPATDVATTDAEPQPTGNPDEGNHVTTSEVVRTVTISTEITQIITTATTTTLVATETAKETYFTTVTEMPKYTAPPPPPAPAPEPTHAPEPYPHPQEPAPPAGEPPKDTPPTNPAPPADDGSNYPYYPPGTDPKPTKPAGCPQEFYDSAVKYCNSLYEVPACKALVDTDFYISSCIHDAIRVGSFVFAEGGKRQMMGSCLAKLDAKQNSADPIEVEESEKIVRESVYLKEVNCGEGCGAHGQCTPNGCICNAGFGGLKCDVDMNTLPIYEADKPVQNAKGEVVPKTPAAAIGGNPATAGAPIISGASSSVAGTVCALVAVVAGALVM
ncbi:hypothetical protein HDU85_006421 [Gaertneriomyces sp. JEL0708]|nr:hypothetical protein HDU85_006421 [Gaertneriomyces sp. JEL0708]